MGEEKGFTLVRVKRVSIYGLRVMLYVEPPPLY
jgi:hypothetical protein